MTTEVHTNLTKFPKSKIKFPGVRHYFKGDVFEVITLKNTLAYVTIFSKIRNNLFISPCTKDGEIDFFSDGGMWNQHSQVYRLVKEGRWRLIKRDEKYVPKPKEKYYRIRLPGPSSPVPSGRFY